MDPTTTANPTIPRPVMDMARPQPAPHPAAVAPVTPIAQAPAAPQPTNAGLTTNIVDNIPMHAPAQPVKPAVNEDDELDGIMKDIGHELKQADRKTTKKHRSLFGRKHHAPAPQSAAMPPAQPVQAPTAIVPVPAPAAPAPQVKTTAAAAQTKQPKTSSAPLGVIFMTILVTGALIAAAVYSYK